MIETVASKLDLAVSTFAIPSLREPATVTCITCSQRVHSYILSSSYGTHSEAAAKCKSMLAPDGITCKRALELGAGRPTSRGAIACRPNRTRAAANGKSLASKCRSRLEAGWTYLLDRRREANTRKNESALKPSPKTYGHREVWYRHYAPIAVCYKSKR
mgnify:CR=1 FL=1